MPTPVRVLVIEDNQHDFVMVRESLRQAAPGQFELVAANRLSEGVTHLQENSFAAVLLDLSLPDSEGIDTFTTLWRHAPEVPVVILSGNPSDQVAQKAIELGAQDYVIKGVESGELLVRTLRYAMVRQRLTDDLRASELQLRLMAEQLPALLWTTDSQLRLMSVRGRDLGCLSMSRDEAIGQPVKIVFGDGDPTVEVIHEQALSGESVSSDLSCSVHRFHAHVEPLRDHNGGIVGTIGVAVDVTREHKLARDVEAAHRIQRHMLPTEAPKIPGFDIAGACYSAEHCSGDFFDYIPLDADHWAIVLADVSGHGFGPAIVASAIRSYLRSAAVLGHHVHEMLALSNQLLITDSSAQLFASAFVARLDIPARSFQFASAGHPAYLLRRSRELETLETLCVPLGVREDEIFPVSSSIRMHRGDLLLMASDGLFEARSPSGEFLGLERSLDLVRSLSHLPAHEIVRRIREAACEFTGGSDLDDDLTIVIIKRCPSQPAATTVH